MRFSRPGRSDIPVLGVWAALLAAFAAMCLWARERYFWPGDLRMSIWVQDLHEVAGARTLFKVANTLGDLEVLVPLLGLLILLSALRGLWVEAAIFAAAGATKWMQQAIRITVDRTQSAPDPPPPPKLYPNNTSFPSGHMYGEIIVYGLLFYFAGRLFRDERIALAVRLLCAAEILAGAPARMYNGAHWPSDLYGSVVLSALVLVLALWLDRKILRGEAAAWSSEELLGHPAVELPAESRRT